MFPVAHTSLSQSSPPGNLNGLLPLHPASTVSLWSQTTASDQLRWYAVYTKSRHEKRIKEQLDSQSLESFLPLYETVHRWKDRRVLVRLPVFSGYLFVRMVLAEHRKPVVTVPGVVNLVGRPGCPTPIEDHEIEALRLCSVRGQNMMPHAYLTAGRRVRVRQGPLADMEGILVRRKGKSRLILSVQLIARAVAVEVDAADVVAVGHPYHNPSAA
ncbi:MAG: UpxY family transcription antiterminator [Terriglobales bacterium]